MNAADLLDRVSFKTRLDYFVGVYRDKKAGRGEKEEALQLVLEIVVALMAPPVQAAHVGRQLQAAPQLRLAAPPADAGAETFVDASGDDGPDQWKVGHVPVPKDELIAKILAAVVMPELRKAPIGMNGKRNVQLPVEWEGHPVPPTGWDKALKKKGYRDVSYDVRAFSEGGGMVLEIG